MCLAWVCVSACWCVRVWVGWWWGGCGGGWGVFGWGLVGVGVVVVSDAHVSGLFLSLGFVFCFVLLFG